MIDQRLEQLAVTRLSYRDPTGAILIRLDAEGSVEDIAISDDWKQRGLDPESFSGALLAAVERAVLQRLDDRAEATAEARVRRRPPADVGEGGAVGRLLATAATHVDDSTAARLIDDLGEVMQRLDQLASRMAAIAGSRYLGTSTSGHVRALCDGNGDLLDVDCDRDWLRRTSGPAIGREAVAAVREAVRSAASARLAADGSATD